MRNFVTFELYDSHHRDRLKMRGDPGSHRFHDTPTTQHCPESYRCVTAREKKFERPLTEEEKASIHQHCAAIRILPQHIWDTGTKYPNYG
jgi:hypothetical protein